MKPEVYELTVPAKVDKLSDVLAFVESVLGENISLMKAQTQLEVALEELFVNIAYYAYPDSDGEADIRLTVTSEYIEITLSDSGIPYNPLAKPDPDVTLSADDRAIGGLGIFMTKKLMDDISYEYVDGKNITTIRKNI